MWWIKKLGGVVIFNPNPGLCHQIAKEQVRRKRDFDDPLSLKVKSRIDFFEELRCVEMLTLFYKKEASC